MAGHLREKIRVTGHITESRGYFHMKLSWTDHTMKRCRLSKSTELPIKGNRKRAEDMLRKFRKEHETFVNNIEVKPEPEDMLFADFMEMWLEVIRPKVKLTTFGGYQQNVNRAIAPYFRMKGIYLRKLTAEDVEKFYAEQMKQVTGMTVSKYHANISSALKYAVLKGYVPQSVMGRVERPKIVKFVGKHLKASETIKLFEAVKGHKLELGVIFGAFYGLRRSEIVGLRWESFNFEANTFTIEHTVTVAKVDGITKIVPSNTTKTKSSLRSLPLVPAIRDMLLKLKQEQEHNRKLCGKAYNKADIGYVYVDTLGYRIKPDYLSCVFPAFLESNGIKRVRFHDLRHSCASLLLANGISLKQIQEWLGHSDFSITANLYAHLDFESKHEAAAAMKWFGETSLAKGEGFSQHPFVSSECETVTDTDPNDSAKALPDFINQLFASGVPWDLIQAWLAQVDITAVGSLNDSFTSFAAEKMTLRPSSKKAKKSLDVRIMMQ